MFGQRPKLYQVFLRASLRMFLGSCPRNVLRFSFLYLYFDNVIKNIVPKANSSLFTHKMIPMANDIALSIYRAIILVPVFSSILAVSITEEKSQSLLNDIIVDRRLK